VSDLFVGRQRRAFFNYESANMKELAIGFAGAIFGAICAWFFSWRQEVRLARHRFAHALFKLHHALKHRKSENIYDALTDEVVFEIWDVGMAYSALYPNCCSRGDREKLGYLLGLMETIEGNQVQHGFSDRSLPSVDDALQYIDDLVILLGYKTA
jgi:hypothetical protein